MTYSVHPAAERDLANASDFYNGQAGAGVAQRFLAEFERVAELVARSPEAGNQLASGRRIFHMKVFPYSVVYRVLDSGIRVVVVRHHRRNPRYGMGRV